MKQNPNKIQLSVEAAITLILMAGVPVFIKFTSATPLTIGLFRLSVATALIVLILRPARSLDRLKKRMVFPMILMGLIFAIHWMTYFLSIKKSTASIGLMGMSTYGIHLIVLGWLIRNDKPNWFDLVALAMALTGTYIIVPEFSLANNVTFGMLLGILSGFCFAILPVLHQHYNYIPERLRVLGQSFFALLVFSFFIPWTEWKLSAVDWWSLLYLAVPGTFIAHTLWIRVTTRISTIISSLIFYLIIPMTMLISHFWLSEPMPIEKIAGAFLIIVGNIISLGGKVIAKN